MISDAALPWKTLCHYKTVALFCLHHATEQFSKERKHDLQKLLVFFEQHIFLLNSHQNIHVEPEVAKEQFLKN